MEALIKTFVQAALVIAIVFITLPTTGAEERVDVERVQQKLGKMHAELTQFQDNLRDIHGELARIPDGPNEKVRDTWARVAVWAEKMKLDLEELEHQSHEIRTAVAE